MWQAIDSILGVTPSSTLISHDDEFDNGYLIHNEWVCGTIGLRHWHKYYMSILQHIGSHDNSSSGLSQLWYTYALVNQPLDLDTDTNNLWVYSNI